MQRLGQLVTIHEGMFFLKALGQKLQAPNSTVPEGLRDLVSVCGHVHMYITPQDMCISV